MSVTAMIIAALVASLTITGVNGESLRPFEPVGRAGVLVFTATDCPVSNGYAPEIQRICAAYADRGIGCTLLYEDVGISADAVRTHLHDYRLDGIAAAIDGDGAVAVKAGATITPQVALVDRDGRVRYRGRIDNRYETLGRARRTVTSHDLTDALDALLAGRRIASSEAPAIGCYIVSPELRRKMR